MGRPRSKDGFVFYPDPPNNRQGRFTLEIYATRERNRKRITFFATKMTAGLIAYELYSRYMCEGASKPSASEPSLGESRSHPVIPSMEDAVNTFVSRREKGRAGIVQRHSSDQVTRRFFNHFLPFFKGYSLDSISVDTLQDYKKKVSEKVSPRTGRPMAEKTISYLISEAKEFFDYCVEVGWIARTPFDSTFITPRQKVKQVEYLIELKWLKALLRVRWNNPVFKAIYVIALATGCRVSEIRALRKCAFEPWYGHEDCEDCVIVHIKENLTNENVRKAPKNYRIRRTVIPRWIYEFVAPIFDLSTTEIALSNNRGKGPVSIDKNLKNFRKELASVVGCTADELQQKGVVFHSVRKRVNTELTGHLNDDIRRAILGWPGDDVGSTHYLEIGPSHYQMILDGFKTIFTEEDEMWCQNHDLFGNETKRRTKK